MKSSFWVIVDGQTGKVGPIAYDLKEGAIEACSKDYHTRDNDYVRKVTINIKDLKVKVK